MQIASDSIACALAPVPRRRLLRHREFGSLVGPHLARLTAMAQRILRSDDLARDAVQDGLMALWIEGVRPSDPRAWLARAVLYRSLHASRTRRRRKKYEERARRRRQECVTECDPCRVVERRELRGLLEEAMAGLEVAHRRVIELREICGMDYESIGRELGIPSGTVRSRLHRARAALRERLETRMFEPGNRNQAESKGERHEPSFCVHGAA